METLLPSCVEVHAATKLSLGVVSGVGPSIHVLDGGPRASRGRGCFGDFPAFASQLVWMGRMTYCSPRNVSDSCVKSWRYFRTDRILLETSFYWLSGNIVTSQVQDRCWVLREICRNITVNKYTMAVVTSRRPSASRPTLILSVRHQNTQ